MCIRDREEDVRVGARLGVVDLRLACPERLRNRRRRVATVTERQRSGRADTDAGRLEPFLDPVEAEGALVDVPLRVDVAGVVRAAGDAGLAAGARTTHAT